MRNKRFIIGLLAISCWLLAGAQTQVLTLDSCLSSAKQHNCTIRSAQLEVAISREVKKQMLWKYFPQVSIEGFAFGAARHLVEADVTEMGLAGSTGDFLKQAFDLLNALGQVDNPDFQLSSEVKWMRWGVSAQGEALQPVYWGGQIVNANKLAQLGIDAAQLKQEVSERDVLQEVTETYWLLAGLMEKRATVSKASELLDTIAHVAQTAYNHGLVTANDLMRVQLKHNEISTKALQLENGIRIARRLLCQMAGLPYSDSLQLEELPDNETIDFLPQTPESIRIEGRPETKLLDLNVRYNQLMKKMTIGETLPHLGIGVTGGYNNFFEKNRFNAIAFAQLSIPLTGWGETAHKIKQHNIRIQLSEMMREDMRVKMEIQNTHIYDQLTEAIQLVAQHRSSRDLAEENYRIALMNYRAGVGTMTELMESEALLLQAENAYTDARISYRTSLRKFTDFNAQ